MIKTYYLINILYFHLITLFYEKNTTSFFNFSFFSCAEDDVDTMKLQSVYTEIEITNCQNMSFSIWSSGGTDSFTFSGKNYTYTTNTFQLSVIENTSFFYQLSVAPSTYNFTTCIDIVTRVYHNNSLHETRTYSVGPPGSPTLSCSHISVGEMYSIIAD